MVDDVFDGSIATHQLLAPNALYGRAFHWVRMSFMPAMSSTAAKNRLITTGSK